MKLGLRAVGANGGIFRQLEDKNFMNKPKLVISVLLSTMFVFSPLRTTAQSNDNCSEAKLRALGIVVVNCSGSSSGQCTTQSSTSPYTTNGLLSLTYPQEIDSMPDLADKINTVIFEKYPDSKWLGLEQWIIDQSKVNNVNPLFIVSTGGVESQWGNSQIGRNNNNYFGATASDTTYKDFGSPQEGILFLIEGMPGYLDGSRGFGKYKDVKNIYEYSSVHQVGSVVYPNQPFDPEDKDEKPGNINDLWDARMGVYSSWDESANLRPDVNPKYKGGIYNPLVYYRNNISIINKITGSSFPDSPESQTTSCESTLTAGPNGWDLPGEGQNPMVYYSQRTSGEDPAVQGYFGADLYGPGPISYCGCGPTSWAMIVSTLTGAAVNPAEVASWASSNGWQQPPSGGPCGGSGWWWSDNTASEEKWGVKANQIVLSQVAEVLRAGHLVIMSAGEGPFTTNGHLLVIRAVTEDGLYLFADPNDYNDTRPAADVFNGQSKSRTPLASDQFSSSINGLWEIQPL